MDFVNDFEKIIHDVFCVLGKPIDKSKYRIIDRGLPHKPKTLPNGMMGIYTFWYKGQFLKIGKAGTNSNARFFSQHYYPRSAQSTLAASILRDRRMGDQVIDKNNVGN